MLEMLSLQTKVSGGNCPQTTLSPLNPPPPHFWSPIKLLCGTKFLQIGDFVFCGNLLGVMNGPLKFSTARKILPLLDLLAKFKWVLACSCSPNFCVAHKLAKQIFYFCSCSQKNRSARHARKDHSSPLLLLTLGQIGFSFGELISAIFRKYPA